MHFNFQEGTLAFVLASKAALKHMLWLPKDHFTMCSVSEEGTLACILDPKGLCLLDLY